MDFDTLTELATLRQQTAAIRKPRHLQSRLDRHRAEREKLQQLPPPQMDLFG